MRFTSLAIPGAFLIESDPITDERGAFARLFCAETFASHGLISDFRQRSMSFNHRSGTLRGLHFQRSPHAETKIVRCTAGAIFDVIVDLRQGSPTFGGNFTVVLSAVNRTMLYVPAGCAHGFLTLSDATEVYYEITPAFVAEASSGIAWNDPDLAIAWPEAPRVISDRDRALPFFSTIPAV
jgi:dTDP-4-dehydrorhamnose 3,5-epimerase